MLAPMTAVVVATGLVLAGTGASAATAQPEDGLPSGTVSVDGQQTPILGSFVYHQFHDDTNPEIRGLVHGVRRVEGGTVLYYSIGASEQFSGSMAFPTSTAPYDLNFGVDLTLVDTASLVAYRPLWDEQTTFATSYYDLNSQAGELRVGWALFPELPADVTSVQVTMPWGTAAGEVPVEDGALEPVAEEPAPYLGEGWPAVPEGAALAQTDPVAVTYDLARRSSDLAGTAAVEETTEQVAVTLDANVLFATGSAELSPQAQSTLATVGADIAARATGQVQVTGHTDSDGTDEANQTLSEQRAAAVLAVLQPVGGDAVTWVAVGKGESEPVAPNDSDEGKQANRRVAVVYTIGNAS
ncbi:OmpA family protein [Cellulomonas soli]|uniref:OmpA family protein n=1 Tax=Cellulomonas soli TaxID=931535 RepID=UPI003F85159B